MSDIAILLVDDNPHDSAFALLALAQVCRPERIVHVQDGQAALDFLFSQGSYASRPRTPPRVVLLDLKLPKIDGIEVLRRMRADAATNELPVVILTSSREESDVLATYGLGVNSYVVKPVEAEEYTGVLTRLGRYWTEMNQPPARRNL